MRFLTEVKFDGFKPAIWVALGYADLLYKQVTGKSVIVTTGQEGVHKDLRNIHGNGLAVDIRTHGLTKDQRQLLFSELTTFLNPLGFDIVLEDVGTENEHIHIEFDPKGIENFYAKV